jgi:hypothetical protein
MRALLRRLSLSSAASTPRTGAPHFWIPSLHAQLDTDHNKHLCAVPLNSAHPALSRAVRKRVESKGHVKAGTALCNWCTPLSTD